MKLKLITLALAGVLGSASGSLMAEEATQGSMYLMPTIGYMNADSDLEADNDMAYGLRIGKEISQHWDVQLGLSHADLDADNNINGLATRGDYKQTLFGLDALYMFSRDKFRPFLLAGFGAARNNVDYTVGGVNVGDSTTSWMGNVGLGFQYFFTNTIGMQADLRHVWSRAEDKSRTLFGNDRDEIIGNTLFNIGVIFNFGAPKQTVAAAPMEPVAAMDEIAPYDEAPVPELFDPSQQPEPEPVGPDAPAFAKMTLAAEVLFGFDKDNLKDDGKKILDVEVVEKMKAHPEVELVLITGHTDRIGDDKYNQKLSERRAAQVKKYIASQGIAESRLHAVGKGETQPVVDCKGVRGKKLIECLQPNRRVVVEIEAQRQIAP